MFPLTVGCADRVTAAGPTLVDELSNEEADLVTASESEFSAKCGCEASIVGASSGDRVGGGSQRHVYNLLCLSALAAAAVISAVL